MSAAVVEPTGTGATAVVPTSTDSSPSRTAARGTRHSRGPVPQILRAVGTGLSAAALVLAIALAALVIVIPMAVGGQALTVLTNSMAPTMPPGTLVIIKPVPIEEIKVGDVLTYQIKSGDPAVVSHRVVSRTLSTTGEITFITKGDNNDVEDATPVTAPQLRGVVWYHLPLLGWVNSALSGGNRSWLVPVVAVGCFGYAAWAFTSAALGRRRGKGKVASKGRRAVGVPVTDAETPDSTSIPGSDRTA